MIKKRFSEDVFETSILVKYWTIEEFWLDVWDFDWYCDRKWTMYIKQWCNIEKTLPHEVLHFIYDALLDRDISLTAQTEETFAYMNWFYFEKIYKWLMKQIKQTQPLLKTEKK